MADKLAVPLNIYEIDLASWKTRYGMSNRDPSAILNYKEIADELIPYIKEMGYTHVAVLSLDCKFDNGINHDSRFGTAEDFAFFVDRLHCSGIGVILDRISTRKPSVKKDGETQTDEYFYTLDKKNTAELITKALYWLENFHIDGLRGETVCPFGLEETTAEFFGRLTSAINKTFPDVITFAVAVDDEDLSFAESRGFDFIQDTDISRGFLEYAGCDPFFRKYHHQKVTFSGAIAPRNRVISVNHADVSGGNKALIDKVFGYYEDKFAGFRAMMCHFIANTGKKLFFMGCEYGQFREWDCKNQLEWFMLDYDMHRKLKSFVADINDFYLKTPEFSVGDFRWVNFEDTDKNVISYIRGEGSGELICVMNFSGVDIGNYCVYVDSPGTYDIVLNSDEPQYGGLGMYRIHSVHTDADSNGRYYLSLNLAKLSGMYLRRANRTERAILD